MYNVGWMCGGGICFCQLHFLRPFASPLFESSSSSRSYKIYFCLFFPTSVTSQKEDEMTSVLLLLSLSFLFVLFFPFSFSFLLLLLPNWVMGALLPSTTTTYIRRERESHLLLFPSFYLLSCDQVLVRHKSCCGRCDNREV